MFGAVEDQAPEVGESSTWDQDVAAMAVQKIVALYDQYTQIVASLPGKIATQRVLANDPTISAEQRAAIVAWGEVLQGIQAAVNAGDYAIQTVVGWSYSPDGS